MISLGQNVDVGSEVNLCLIFVRAKIQLNFHNKWLSPISVIRTEVNWWIKSVNIS